MLNRTTHLTRFVLPIVFFLAWTPMAHAWSWPVQGPVLQPFLYDAAHPYAAGQHRGIDIGADAAGETVIAPSAGTVSFAGTVPTSGQSVTIQTGDGYSVTLTHLGSILVAKGAAVAEGDAVGTIGPSGTPEFAQPYVHLGVRITTDPNGYLDPLRFLPAISGSGSTQDDSSTQQPSTTTTTTPSAPAAPASTGRHAKAKVHKSRSRVSQQGRSRTSEARSTSRVRTQESSKRPASQPVRVASGAKLHQTTPQPVAWSRIPGRLRRLDAGHEIRSTVRIAQPLPARAPAETQTVLLPLALNGAAALIAVAAAIAAGVRRRRRPTVGAVAQVLQLPRPALERPRAA